MGTIYNMDIDKLVENYFAPKNSLTQEALWELFDEALSEVVSAANIGFAFRSSKNNYYHCFYDS